MFYSQSVNTWFDPAMREQYEAAGNWPVDAVEYPRELFDEVVSNRPSDQQMQPDANGDPVLVPIPPADPAQVLLQTRLSAARSYLNDTQWWQVRVDLGELNHIPNDISQARTAAQAFINAHP